jgi:hypothetical protein
MPNSTEAKPKKKSKTRPVRTIQASGKVGSVSPEEVRRALDKLLSEKVTSDRAKHTA